jgi:hypothetical protein
MPFDIPEENQDETAEPTGLPKINYPFAGAGVQPFPYLRLSMNGTPPTDKPMGPNQETTGASVKKTWTKG